MLSLGVCIWLWVKWRALVSNSYLPETRRWFSVRHSITYNSRPPLGILLSPFLGHWPHITPINTVTSAFTCSVCWFRTRMTHIGAYVEVFGSQWVDGLGGIKRCGPVGGGVSLNLSADQDVSSPLLL
ncbi:rCG43060 [Rattus norvegicus]|uniref:RCG43060 n=1 Tax=Rattus norvegicus TaxID=10116 RepID=A6IVP9_RAT|nr:rCG43060 [Rattus norvegicus]